MTKSVNRNTSVKLSAMLFLQYMMYAVWWVPLAAYLTKLDVSSIQKSLILSSMALGCLASPIIGMLADRYFAGQKVLACLNVVNAVMLLGAGLTQNPNVLFVCLLVAMLGYMPSWGLTSSIAMTHAPSEDYPKIRVFGSVGWVASGLFSLLFVNVFSIDFDGTSFPFYCGAAVSLIAVVTNLFLPNTPPPSKGEKTTVGDLFGLGTLKLMKDRNFTMFIALSFLSMIPFAMYYSFFSEFLLSIEIKYISVTMNWGVLAEMGFLMLVPVAVKRYGLRTTMLLGLVALVFRYGALYLGGMLDQTWMFYGGILVHGLIFGFFYVGGQIYIDRNSPKELKSQAQGFIFLVTFGAGLLVGNFVCGKLIDMYRTDGGEYNWDMIWAFTLVSSVLLLVAFMLLFREDTKSVEELRKQRGGPKEKLSAETMS